MPFNASTQTKTDRIQAVLTLMDAGVGHGVLRVYDGSQPAAGGAATTLLAEFTMPDPSGSLVGLTLTMALPDPAVVLVTGTATWCRYLNAAGTNVFDSNVGITGSGAPVILSDTALTAAGLVTMNSGTLA